MSEVTLNRVLPADRHHGLNEDLRDVAGRAHQFDHPGLRVRAWATANVATQGQPRRREVAG
jgi:hypothetical protein